MGGRSHAGIRTPPYRFSTPGPGRFSFLVSRRGDGKQPPLAVTLQ